MIVLNFPQGSPEWLDARLGIPTASQFSRILTPKTMKLSASAEGYMHELLAEEMLGHPIDETESQFMTRGSSLEQDALKFYEFQRDETVLKVGLVLRDDGMVGASPDGLVGEDGGLEIKCLNAVNHVGQLLGSDDEKAKCQIQGALWLTGRKWWDRLSYNPELPSTIKRHVRDEEFIERLALAVDGFLNVMAHARAKLIEDGFMTELTIEKSRERRR